MAKAFVVAKVEGKEELRAVLSQRLDGFNPRIVGSVSGSAFPGEYHAEVECDAPGDELFFALARWFGEDQPNIPAAHGALLWFRVD